MVAATLLDMRPRTCCLVLKKTSRRAMPTWRPAICCFPGSCSTAPSKKPRGPRRTHEALRGLRGARRPPGAAFATLLPELAWITSPQDLARLAADALTASVPTVQVGHLHDPVVPVREQARVVATALAAEGQMTFHDLVADAATRAVVVSRFLALLELYRRGVVEFAQDEALGTLTITWTGTDAEVDIDVDDDIGQASAGGAPASSVDEESAAEGTDTDE